VCLYTPRVRRCLGLVLLLVACGREPTPPPLATAERPQDGGTLVRRLESNIHSLNPLYSENPSERYVARYLFTPLVYLDATMRPVPGIARKWSVSDDHLVYRFVLDERATFSDGSRVRARDVVFTLEKIRDPKSLAHNAGEFAYLDLARTRVIDETTVDVAFQKALAAQMNWFADVHVLPEHVYGRGNFRDDYNARALGSGPYTLVRREGDTIVVQRRRDYWREKPHIDRVIFHVITDFTTAWLALKRGDVDESYIPSYDWQQAHNDPVLKRDLNFSLFSSPDYICVAWNLHHPILRDIRVRRALAMSVSIEDALRLYSGTARAFTGPFSPDHAGYNPAVHAPPYAPADAKKLLAEAGWIDRDHDGVLDKDGKPFHIVLLIPGTGVQPFALLMKAQLNKIGVQLDIDSMDLAAAQQRIEKGDYDAACFTWALDPDADFYPLLHSSQFPTAVGNGPTTGRNVVFYANKDVDQLLDQARTELNPERRRTICQSIHQIIADDQPYSFYIQLKAKWGMRKRLRGVEISPLRGLFLWYPGELGWWIADQKQ
jgi:peptide/nickel transport system substrate-binding protein